MRIVRNERHIRLRSLYGKYGVPAGLLTLVLNFFLIRNIEWTTLAVAGALLVLGFVLVVVGGYLLDRYSGPLAHHDALASALKGLDDSYVLLQYVLPVPHVLFEPGGLTVFLVKPQGGQVRCQEPGRWEHRQKNKLLRQFAGQEGVGVPDAEATRQTGRLERWIASRLPGAEAVVVRVGVVFVNPDLDLDASGSSVPVFHGKRVKAWLRGPGKLKPLPPAVYDQVADALGVASREA
jgi:hypothetical protein